MCGRYSQAADLAKLARRFGLTLRPELAALKPRYNLAPSEPAPAVVFVEGTKHLELMSWGLTRQWSASKPPIFVINLRAEKLATGPFRSVLSRRHCLIPADGFYEWKTAGKKKMPFRYTLKDEELFAMPAIYDDLSSSPEGALKSKPSVEGQNLREGPRRAFCIFTVEANSLVAAVHHRMPAILPKGREDAWLDPGLTDIGKIVSLLQPYPPEKMSAWAVSDKLNSAKFDDPDLIKPVSVDL